MGKRPREKVEKWKYTKGKRPYTVTVFERTPRGRIYARVWDRTMGARGGWRKRSLGHSDRARAEAYADAQHAKLKEGDQEIRSGRISVARLFALYQAHRTPRKTPPEQKADARRIEMWTRWLGGKSDPHKVSLREWDGFAEARASGEVDARGRQILDPKKRRAVRARTVQADMQWLRWVFSWASKSRTAQGNYMMRENPVRGLSIQGEKNPRRPLATWDRYEALRVVSDRVMMQVPRPGEKAADERSHLSELLDLAVATGRRISAICSLHYADLRLERSPIAPHGSIRWPSDTDKAGKEQTVQLSALGRRAVDRVLKERPGAGDAPLFPSPKDSSRPVHRHLASAWLLEAEELAKLESLKGGLWHPFRRMWATSRKDLPAQDVTKAGGWATVRMVEEVYTQADDETTLSVVLHDARVTRRAG